jgi:glycosyltransferase involved in cell wall biosynthesis
MSFQSKEVIMLLDNAFTPDMRVHKEALCLKELGCDVTIFAWDRDCKYPTTDEKDGISIKRIRTKSKYQLGLRQLFFLTLFYIKATPALLKRKIDVIYCHDLLTLPLGILVKSLKRRKLIYDAHEIYWMMEAKKYNKFVLSAIKFSENLLLKFVDEFVTVSEQRAEYYKQYYRKPIYIVGNYYNPIDVDIGHRKQARKKLGISDNSFLITYIGGLNITREFELLVQYASTNKNVFVLIGGRGYWQNFIQDAARKLDNLTYLGWVSNPIEYYSISDAIYYVLKEDYPYNHFNAPNNLFLSIAMRIPIVANSLGMTGKIIEQHKIGSVIKTRDIESFGKAINYIIENKEAITSNLEKSQKHYNWNISKSQLTKMLNSL